MTAALLALVFLSSGLFLLLLEQRPPYEGGALVIDTLSSWDSGYPIPREILDSISNAGFEIHYYERVDTEFLRYLPARGYKLIVLRVHSNLGAFTVNESYSSNRYILDQLLGRLGVFVPEGETTRSFSITPEFISKSMKGRFDNSVVVLMGCRGLQMALASAFLEKGAKVFVGWSNMVTLTYTDIGIALFLQKFLVENKTLSLSIGETMKETPLDPVYQARLGFYPRMEGELRAEEVGA